MRNLDHWKQKTMIIHLHVVHVHVQYSVYLKYQTVVSMLYVETKYVQYKIDHTIHCHVADSRNTSAGARWYLKCQITITTYTVCMYIRLTGTTTNRNSGSATVCLVMKCVWHLQQAWSSSYICREAAVSTAHVIIDAATGVMMTIVRYPVVHWG